jgi:hypothetical protein
MICYPSGMRKQTVILLFLLGLSLALFLSERPRPLCDPVPAAPPKETEAPEAEQNELQAALPEETVPAAEKNGVVLSPVQQPRFTEEEEHPIDPDLRLKTPPGAAERVLSPTTRILSRRFEGTEYSSSRFPSVFQGDTQGMDLHSKWLTARLFPDRALPALRLRIMRNPETGEYEPAGGSVGIPGTGLEAVYDAIPSTEEQKAILQWRKSF